MYIYMLMYDHCYGLTGIRSATVEFVCLLRDKIGTLRFQ